MALVDVEYEVYNCPHCKGYIVLRKQFPLNDSGCIISVGHHSVLPKHITYEVHWSEIQNIEMFQKT